MPCRAGTPGKAPIKGWRPDGVAAARRTRSASRRCCRWRPQRPAAASRRSRARAGAGLRPGPRRPPSREELEAPLPCSSTHKCIVRASKRLTENLRSAFERSAPRPRLSCHAGAGKRHVRDTAAQMETSTRPTGVGSSSVGAGGDGVCRSRRGRGGCRCVRWSRRTHLVLLRSGVAASGRWRIGSGDVFGASERGQSERQRAGVPVLLPCSGAARGVDGARRPSGLRHRDDGADCSSRVAVRSSGADDRADDSSCRVPAP